MNSQIIHTPQGSIEYRSIGKGIPVLFVHGGHSNCQETLCHKGFNLDQFQLITPSRPGYGKTPLKDHITPKSAADLIAALLDSLSIEKVVVYGISAGGLTAIELAGNYPKRVNKLILASAISKRWLNEQDPTYKTAKRMFSPGIENFIWSMVRFFSGVFPAMIARSFYPQFSTNPPHQFEKEDIQELIISMKYYSSKSGFLNDIDQTINDEALAKIKCPTLIIHSENDASVPLEHAKYAQRMIKNSKTETLKNDWGHLFWIGKDSERILSRTIEFIKA